MKKTILLVSLLTIALGAGAQTYTTLGVGIASPQGTLHAHSSTNIIPPDDPIPMGDRTDPVPGDPPANFNTIFRLTNTITGAGSGDGFVVDQYNKNVTLRQYENADMTIANHNASLVLTAGGKVGVGTVSSSHFFNVEGTSRLGGMVSVNGNMTLTGGININNTHIHLTASGKAYFADEVSIGSGFYCSPAGALKVKSLRVTSLDWSDYVFDPAYRLKPLEEVERFVQENRHLPDIPSAAEVEEKGVDVGEMNKLLLQKVEELTLYVIDLQKQLDELKSSQ